MLLARSLIKHIRASSGEAAARARLARVALLALGFGLAVAIRIPLLGFKSVDFFNERIQSYPLIQQMGLSALASSASNYNPPFFYILFVISRLLPALPMAAAVKLPAILTDFLCALFVFLIVRLKYPRGFAAWWAALAVVLAPTVMVNAAMWGQIDSMYAAGILACVYFLMRSRPGWALLAFALAFTIKLQAIFLAPLLMALWLRRDISWKPFLLVPAALLLAIVPAWLAGRPLLDLLKIYWQQAGEYEKLTMNAPSVFAWLPDSPRVFHSLYLPGLIMAAAVAWLLVWVIGRSRRLLPPDLLLELSLLTVLVVPFFLPKMHERYFFPADVLSIPFALYNPSFAWVAVAVIGVSSLSYLPFLFGISPIPLLWLATILLMVICALAYHSSGQLRTWQADPEQGQAPT